jgi:hypothetical protein
MIFGRRTRWAIAGILALALTFGSLTPPAEASDVPPSIAALEVLNVSCGPGSLTALQRLRAEKLLKSQVAQNTGPLPSTSPAPFGTPIVPQTSPSPSPSAAPSGAPASPAPSATPTLVPLRLPPPAAGAGVLVPPPPPRGVTPPPIPTPSPPPTTPPGPTLLIQASGTPPAITPKGTPTPFVTPSPEPTAAGPTPIPTLGPFQYAVLADKIEGSTKNGLPADAIGHVNIFYQDGQLVGDRAHYDGERFIDVTGERVYLRNKLGDTVFYADSIRFDTRLQKAMLRNGHGETLEGVERGALHFTAQNMQTDRFGTTTGTNASVTTCENPHGGYHIEGKSFDLHPDDRLIIRKATLFLGGFPIFFLPLLVIPLTHDNGQRRPTTFAPVFGYSQAEGAYMKSTIGFGTTPYYYGYYRLDIYTKLGLGLGYVAFFRKQNNKRSADVNFYRFRTNSTAQQSYNLAADETENFSSTLRSQLGFSYQGNYGPGIFLPPSDTINGTIAHTGYRESQNYTFQRYTSGSQQSSINLGFTDQRQLTDRLSNGVNVTYSENLNSYSGIGTTTSTLHLNTLTHYTSPGIDYDLTVDKTESGTPFGIAKLPELSVRPHSVFPNERIIPISAQFLAGEYSQPQTPNLATQAFQGNFTFGPALFKVFRTSDFSGTVAVQQYYFGTGDLKALITQQFSLSTPFGPHILNAVTYNEQNSNGPLAEPFTTFDVLGTNTKGAQDVLRIYNKDVYALTLTDGTNFNRMAQPVQYQLLVRPTYRSSVVVGGAYIPGPGNGFATTNLQVITPVGRGSDVQFSTNVDWKNKGRLIDKALFYRVTIGDCYQILASYNQDLKQFNVALQLLAFPSQSASFGLGNQGPIIPQSFSF